jgi:hypothetical protein
VLSRGYGAAVSEQIAPTITECPPVLPWLSCRTVAMFVGRAVEVPQWY